MHVAVGAGDVQVTAQHQPPAGVALRGGPLPQGLQEDELGREVLAAVRHVDRGHEQLSEVGGDDARLMVEGGMGEGRALGHELPADAERDSRVAAGAVPVPPVSRRVVDLGGKLIGFALDLLEAYHVRAVPGEPFQELGGARPQAVDVPGGDDRRHQSLL